MQGLEVVGLEVVGLEVVGLEPITSLQWVEPGDAGQEPLTPGGGDLASPAEWGLSRLIDVSPISDTAVLGLEEKREETREVTQEVAQEVPIDELACDIGPFIRRLLRLIARIW